MSAVTAYDPRHVDFAPAAAEKCARCGLPLRGVVFRAVTVDDDARKVEWLCRGCGPRPLPATK